MLRMVLTVINLILICLTSQVSAEVFNDLVNRKSGISLSLSGVNGTDWAIERTFHDEAQADQILYIKSDIEFSLLHNANNSVASNLMPNYHIGIVKRGLLWAAK